MRTAPMMRLAWFLLGSGLLSMAPALGDTRYETVAVLPQLHVLTQGNAFHVQPRGNVSVIEQTRGIVLVDSGGSPAAAEQVIGTVRSLGPKPVTAIVLTHWHGDHVLGVRRLLQEWPEARVIATPATRDRLASPATDRFMPGDDDAANARFLAGVRDGVTYLRHEATSGTLVAAEREGFARAADEYEAFAQEMTLARRPVPQETFDGSLELPDRMTPVEVRFLGRANTEGDAVVRLPRQGVVITGDVVVAPVPFGGDTHPREWIAVLRTIEGWHPRILVPGHGAVQRDLGYVEALLHAIEEAQAHVAPFADTTLDAAAVAVEVTGGSFEARIAGNDPWLSRWYRRYWHEPLIASALGEARAALPH